VVAVIRRSDRAEGVASVRADNAMNASTGYQSDEQQGAITVADARRTSYSGGHDGSTPTVRVWASAESYAGLSRGENRAVTIKFICQPDEEAARGDEEGGAPLMMISKRALLEKPETTRGP
jgi:hypothetical protein